MISDNFEEKDMVTVVIGGITNLTCSVDNKDVCGVIDVLELLYILYNVCFI